VAHLFGKHPPFPKPVRTSTEQIPNKTPLYFKKIVILPQRESKAVKSRHAMSKAVKKKQLALKFSKTRQLYFGVVKVPQLHVKAILYMYF